MKLDKLYSVVLHISEDFERAILVRAANLHEVYKITDNYRGTVMSITEVYAKERLQTKLSIVEGGLK